MSSLPKALPTETYLENGDRANFENGGLPVRLHPDFASLTWENRGFAPLILTGPELNSQSAPSSPAGLAISRFTSQSSR